MSEISQEENQIFIFSLTIRLDPIQKKKIIEKTSLFIEEWKSNSSQVYGKVWIGEDHFVIVEVFQSIESPSGCSKDKLYHFMESLNLEMNLIGTELSKFHIKSNEIIRSLSLKELKNEIDSGSISLDDQLFPTWMSTKAEMNKSWGKPISFFASHLRLNEKKQVFDM